MSVKLLAEHHLEFLCLKRGCKGSSESTLVKIPHCWKSHVAAQLIMDNATMCPKVRMAYKSVKKKMGTKLKSWCQYGDPEA